MIITQKIGSTKYQEYVQHNEYIYNGKHAASKAAPFSQRQLCAALPGRRTERIPAMQTERFKTEGEAVEAPFP